MSPSAEFQRPPGQFQLGMTNFFALAVFAAFLLVSLGLAALVGQAHAEFGLTVGVIGIVMSAFVAAAIKVANQWERAIVLRPGKFCLLSTGFGSSTRVCSPRTSGGRKSSRRTTCPHEALSVPADLPARVVPAGDRREHPMYSRRECVDQYSAAARRIRVCTVNPWVKLFRSAAHSPPRSQYEKTPRW